MPTKAEPYKVAQSSKVFWALARSFGVRDGSLASKAMVATVGTQVKEITAKVFASAIFRIALNEALVDLFVQTTVAMLQVLCLGCAPPSTIPI